MLPPLDKSEGLPHSHVFFVNHSPREYGYPFERWTAQWLGKHLAKELGIEISDGHVYRLLKEMGLSTRPNQLEASR